MWAPCQVSRLPPAGEERCRQSFVAGPAGRSRPSQAGPKPGPQPSLPKPCELENLGPPLGPGRRGREAGRKGGEISGILRSANCVTLVWLLLTLGPHAPIPTPAPQNVRRIARATQADPVC